MASYIQPTAFTFTQLDISYIIIIQLTIGTDDSM